MEYVKTDELRSSAMKQKLLNRATKVLSLEGLRGYHWGDYRQIPSLIRQAHEEMNSIISPIAESLVFS
ncbi:hypothetical protein ACFLS8_00950 [Chloroflexota bacterium]